MKELTRTQRLGALSLICLPLCIYSALQQSPWLASFPALAWLAEGGIRRPSLWRWTQWLLAMAFLLAAWLTHIEARGDLPFVAAWLIFPLWVEAQEVRSGWKSFFAIIVALAIALVVAAYLPLQKSFDLLADGRCETHYSGLPWRTVSLGLALLLPLGLAVSLEGLRRLRPLRILACVFSAMLWITALVFFENAWGAATLLWASAAAPRFRNADVARSSERFRSGFGGPSPLTKKAPAEPRLSSELPIYDNSRTNNLTLSFVCPWIAKIIGGRRATADVGSSCFTLESTRLIKSSQSHLHRFFR